MKWGYNVIIICSAFSLIKHDWWKNVVCLTTVMRTDRCVAVIWEGPESSCAACGLLWRYFIGTAMVVPEPLDRPCMLIPLAQIKPEEGESTVEINCYAFCRTLVWLSVSIARNIQVSMKRYQTHMQNRYKGHVELRQRTYRKAGILRHEHTRNDVHKKYSMYVCMYVRTYVCYVCLFVCMLCYVMLCMYVCMYVCVCIYVYTYACMYVCMCVCMFCLFVCLFVCLYVMLCMYVFF